MHGASLFMFVVCSLANDFNSLNRRDFLPSLSFLLSSHFQEQKYSNPKVQDTPNDDDSRNKATTSSEWTVVLPLERSSGGTNCVRMSIPGEPQRLLWKTIRPTRIYKLIVDTGSPYLVIPNDSTQQSSYFSTIFDTLHDKSNDNNDEFGLKGLINILFDYFLIDDIEKIPFELSSSNYNPTQDIYGTKLGLIDWKMSSIAFSNNRLLPALIVDDKMNYVDRSVILGALDEPLAKESGGPLLGLVKNSNYTPNNKVDLRPTILDQIRMIPTDDTDDNEREITSFQIDSPNKLFTISAEKNASLIQAKKDVIELVDLRPLGDFVDHYAFIVDELSLNDGEHIITSKILCSDSKRQRPIVAVFDTGLTGCLFTKSLWNALSEKDVALMDPTNIRSVEVLKSRKEADSFISIQSDASKNPFYYISSINLDWFDDEINSPFVVVLGQTFLSQGTLTIDIALRQATFDLP